jgi:hypothetical protein
LEEIDVFRRLHFIGIRSDAISTPSKNIPLLFPPSLVVSGTLKSLPFYARFDVVLVGKEIEEVRLAVQAMMYSLVVSKALSSNGGASLLFAPVSLPPATYRSFPFPRKITRESEEVKASFVLLADCFFRKLVNLSQKAKLRSFAPSIIATGAWRSIPFLRNIAKEVEEVKAPFAMLAD